MLLCSHWFVGNAAVSVYVGGCRRATGGRYCLDATTLECGASSCAALTAIIRRGDFESSLDRWHLALGMSIFLILNSSAIVPPCAPAMCEGAE